jgi:hypothetical protein
LETSWTCCIKPDLLTYLLMELSPSGGAANSAATHLTIYRNTCSHLFILRSVQRSRKLKPLSVYLRLYSPLLDLGRFFCFLILHTVGRTPSTDDRPVARQLSTHRKTQTQNKRTQTFMPWVGFEPMIQAFERAKAVHALDRAATVIGNWNHYVSENSYMSFYISKLCEGNLTLFRSSVELTLKMWLCPADRISSRNLFTWRREKNGLRSGFNKLGQWESPK